MGIGVSIFLIALGAILTFAVHASFSGFSIGVIGVILMAAGVLGLIIDMAIFMPRRRTASTTVSQADGTYPAAPGQTVVREHHTTY